MNPVVAADLVKVFPAPDGGEKRAVDGLSFEARGGEIYGLLGPNGAGKTTTLRILSGLMTPSEGRAIINGHTVGDDPLAVKRSIGFLTASTGLYQRVTPRELLLFFADLNDIPRGTARQRVDTLVHWLEMDEFADLRCGALSTGQRQRTSIARALVADPPILILDEPTLGLDVLTNRLILDFIVRQRDAGKTIILSTHYLDEAERLCDRIGLVHRGKIVAEGTMDELRAGDPNKRLTDVFLSVVHEKKEVALA